MDLAFVGGTSLSTLRIVTLLLNFFASATNVEAGRA